MPRSLNFEYLLTPEGLQAHRRVEIDDRGIISDITPARVEGFDAQFGIPGMPNAHSHAFQRAMPGHGEARQGNDSFWSWRDHMYRLANTLEPQDLYAIARCAYGDMLRAGFTSVAEFHYLHHLPDGTASPDMADAIIAAARDTGIRLVLLPVYYRTGGFQVPPKPRQMRFVHASIDAFCRLLAACTEVPCGIAPHSLRAVPAAELASLVDQVNAVLGGDYPIHMHISEQQAEVDQCIEQYGARPVQVLFDSVAVDSRWNLVHATHADADERAQIVESGARVVLCPLTEAYLGDGLFAATEFLATGGKLCLGSDSNVRIDAIEELRWLEYGQRLRHQSRICLGDELGTAPVLWQHCAVAGARALGQAVGALAVGRFADIVTLNLKSSPLTGIAPQKLLDAWLTGGSRENIADVYVGGEKLVAAGRLAGFEPAELAYEKTMAALAKRMHAAV